MDHDKALLRARIRAARRALGSRERTRAAVRLAEVALGPGPLRDALERWAPDDAAGDDGPGDGVGRRAPAVALYASRPTEPDTGPLRAALAAQGVRVLLPVVLRGGSPLAWLDERERPARLDDAVAVLVPALAVDRSGTRLGQGGGHYDRTLAAHGWDEPRGTGTGTGTGTGARTAGRPLLAAVVHDEEVLAAAALPREVHDVAVDAAVTPSGWITAR